MQPTPQLRRLRYQLTRLGLPGLFGILMLLAAIGIGFSYIQPTYDDIDAMERRVAQVEKEAARLNSEGEAGVAYSPAEQLAVFYQGFPAEDSIPAWLEKIYALAGDGSIKLESGEYSLQKTQQGRLNQYRIAFPIKGSYPKIRKFISGVLASTPAIALDSLQMKRENVGEGNVDARVVFLMYLEPTP